MKREFRFFVALCLFGTSFLLYSGCAKPASDTQSSNATAAEQPAQDDVSITSEESVAAEPEVEVARANDVSPPTLEVPTEPEPELVEETVKTQADAEPPAPLPASEAPLPYDRLETSELKMPAVVLSDQHAAMCKVGVGDQFPAVELPNLDGEKRTLTELLGSKLTLVVFWNATQSTGLEELSDLTRYHLPRFGDKGLSVVAINSGDQPQLAHEMAKHAGTRYPVLSDADGSAFQEVASDRLPRTYLLDSSGKVLWFDLEYSPTTRRDLAAAIRVSLAE